MKRLSPAFVVTGCVSVMACSPAEPPLNPPSAQTSATTTGTAAKKTGVHPVDADGHVVFRRSAGTCYVQVEKKEPPPKDLMSGEKWVDDKTVPCPKEFEEPEFAAIPDGTIWIQNAETGECSHGAMFGNPPPPPTPAKCPPSLEKKK